MLKHILYLLALALLAACSTEPPPPTATPSATAAGEWAQQHEFDGQHAAFSPDGRRVAIGDANGAVTLYEVSTGRELAVLEGHDSAITGIAFSPDGARVAATATDEDGHIWDTASRDVIGTLPNAGAPVVFSPNGDFVATRHLTDAEGVAFWRSNNGRLDRILPEGGRQIIFSADGRAVFNTGRIFDSGSGAEIFNLDTPVETADVRYATFEPETLQVAIITTENTLFTWLVGGGGGERLPLDDFPANSEAFFVSNDKLVVWGGQQMHIVNPQSLNIASSHDLPEALQAAAALPGGRNFITATRAGISLWDALDERPQNLIGEIAASALIISPTGEAFASINEGDVSVWGLS